MDVLTLIFISVLVFIVSIWWTRKKSGQNPLPGPMGLPIVGYIPFLTDRPHVKFQQLQNIYGPVFRVKLGRQNAIVLNDFKSIKEAFAMDAFMGRPPDLQFGYSKETIRTGAFMGMPWKEQRRFFLHMFRDLGLGKTKTENYIKEEIFDLLERIGDMKGSPVEISDLIATGTFNNIASFLFGKRMKHNDPRRLKLEKALNDISKNAGSSGWQSFFSWIRDIMNYFQVGTQDKFPRARGELTEFCKEEVKAHEATLNPNEIRDVIDGYLLEIEKRSGDPDSSFQKDVLLDMSAGIFIAGSETVRVTIDWMLLICAAFPEVQKRIHEEIDEVIGRSQFPTRSDHLMMPYTEAALLECMRWKIVMPLNLLRYTLKDSELNGYFIPKHCHVMANLYAVSNDEKLWGNDVAVYRPERFLSEDGKKVVKPEYLVPFSIGKRACPGKSLAEVELFLYVAAILQKFEISMPPGEKADFQESSGFSLQPKRQMLCMKQRL